MSSIRVFISYSHDSDEHRERVLGLSERLRKDGFVTQLDRYVNGTPPKGWEPWMLDGLDDAAFVLVVCTETYYRRFRGHEEPGVGKGVDWEGALITQEIYKARSDMVKFVPVMFDSADAEFVPEPIGSHTLYVLDSEQRYADLRDFLDGVAGVEPGEIGTRERRQRPRGKAATFGPGSSTGTSDRKIAPSRILRHAPEKLFGREPWLDELDRMWEQRHSKHVFTLVAWGGVGKTSLVAHWVQRRLAARSWPGVERYFDWSFYSQGTGESRQTSSDFFISEALKFFGDDNPTDGGPWERGERLARLVRKRRTLLVLDGIEPLQYPEGDPSGQGGMLKDQGLAALLQGLAADNPGLCVVTTRETLANLKISHDTTAPERRLDELPCEAAQDLLRHLGVDGSDADLAAAWKEAGGHALTVQLLGTYLAEAHGGDIRKQDVVDLQEADRETQGRSAFKVMAAYERWLSGESPFAPRKKASSSKIFRGAKDDNDGPSGNQRLLAILRLTGLFDRPITPDCLAALRTDPPIPGLTDALTGLTETQWNTSLKRLETLGPISLTTSDRTSSSFTLPSSSFQIDAHPLIREYFAEQLRTQHPESFQAAHGRLFDHLCETTEHYPDGLDGLQPLYQAVAHGCLAGRHEEARANVYRDRILRGTGNDGFYSSRKLGAIGSDLSAVAAFFHSPWIRVSPNLSEPAQAWLLNAAAFRLRALGRLTEALEPMQVGLNKRTEQKSGRVPQSLPAT